MIKVTDDKEIRESVLEGLKKNKEKNKEKYGKMYCPCSIERSDNTICQCKEFKELEEGTCHCGLYIKIKSYETNKSR